MIQMVLSERCEIPNKTRRHRLYWRNQSETPRAYADFRDYADVGGKREALIPRDGSRATSDPDIAHKLLADRLSELEERRRHRILLNAPRQGGLAEFASYHLIQKAKSRRVTPDWIAQTQYQLEEAIAFFGPRRELGSVRTKDIQDYTNFLRERPSRSGRIRSDGTVKHYLASLSNLFTRAQSEGYVPPGYNPVSALMDKPVARREEARWLEVHEAALLLEAARRYRPAADALPYMYPLLATFLLTGGRKSEVLGLEVKDISFDRGTVTFRPNSWRRLKTLTSHRTVPLWPQLEEVLRDYVFGGHGPLGRLLFASTQTSEERPVTDIRKSLDGIATVAGFLPGEIRTRLFRHTYCAARLQTLDQDAPVSGWTVSRELGHGGRSMVERVYGHLGNVRHRSAVVEYRVEQHDERLAERLRQLPERP
jgi:integrase